MAKIAINITLYMSEIIYDIENKTALTGDRHKGELDPERVANMKANADEDNRNQILRSIGNALSTLRSKLSEYMESDAERGNNILLSEDSNITLALSMPSNFNRSAIEAISSSLHQYIVDMAIGDWFTITNTADAEAYIAKAAADMIQVRESINQRVRPKRTAVVEEVTEPADTPTPTEEPAEEAEGE